MYTYRDYQLSNKEMKAEGLKWVGITGKTADGSEYLSLFGARVDTKTSDGESSLLAEMVQKLDNSIINSYKADYNNDPANRSPFDSELYSSATNMDVSTTVTSSMVRNNQHIRYFTYVGGDVKYTLANDLSGGVFNWGTGELTTETGILKNGRRGAFATVEKRNNQKLDIVRWAFPTTQAWQNARNRAEKLLRNRKW